MTQSHSSTACQGSCRSPSESNNIVTENKVSTHRPSPQGALHSWHEERQEQPRRKLKLSLVKSGMKQGLGEGAHSEGPRNVQRLGQTRGRGGCPDI